MRPLLSSRLLALFLAALPLGGVAAQPVQGIDLEAVEAARQRVEAGDPTLVPAYEALLAEAEGLLDQAFASVVDKPVSAPSGDPHDYYSIAPYWWPDEDRDDGLPYVRNDGRRNPERDSLDNPALSAILDAVPTLTWAAYFSVDARYAERAAALVRMWFLDPATRMNPHLRYAQAIPGREEGRLFGIIDASSMPELVDALVLLRQQGALSAADAEGLHAWFSTYLDWLLTSSFGREASAASNNHASAYDAQVAAVALYLGRDDVAREVLAAVPSRRIAAHVEPDGRQPEELARTRAYGYSLYNLFHLFNAADRAALVGVDVFGFATDDGRSLRAALDYLVPYAGHPERWPYEQVSGWAGAERRLAFLLRRAAVAYGEPDYERLREEIETDPAARYLLLHPMTPTTTLR